ncbi:MAG: BPL-N domain-containing protein [Ignavibacteria bacterium]|nr:BPL-N domain-containing protein [Ignavibacteria bacterium]
MEKLLIIFFVVLPHNLFSKDIWIYSDYGTWNDGILALEQFLNKIGISHKRIYSDELNNRENFDDVKVICFPGGFSYYYAQYLNETTIENLRKFVSNGGSYIGICAGAYFASSNVVWEGQEYPYSLGLFKGNAIGSIHQISAWDSYRMTKITLNQNNTITKNLNKDWNVLYYGGPYFESNQIEFDVIATWDEYNNLPAIINFYHGKGKVLLIGPHLEIDVNTNSDSSLFASELFDTELDWNLLERLFLWALTSDFSSYFNQYENRDKICPNPASVCIEINFGNLAPSEAKEIKIYNILGECIMRVGAIHELPQQRIDISHLPTGVYFARLGNFTEKFVVIR